MYWKITFHILFLLLYFLFRFSFFAMFKFQGGFIYLIFVHFYSIFYVRERYCYDCVQSFILQKYISHAYKYLWNYKPSISAPKSWSSRKLHSNLGLRLRSLSAQKRTRRTFFLLLFLRCSVKRNIVFRKILKKPCVYMHAAHIKSHTWIYLRVTIAISRTTFLIIQSGQSSTYINRKE